MERWMDRQMDEKMDRQTDGCHCMHFIILYTTCYVLSAVTCVGIKERLPVLVGVRHVE